MQAFTRALRIGLLTLLIAAPAGAANSSAPAEARSVDTGKPFAAFVEKLTAAIQANRMAVVAQACADCGAKTIGATIPGNRVIMVFRPDFAVRMLKASEAAGIEAPIRLYVTERPDGTARLTYRTPSQVFAPYGVAELDAMAGELDAIFAKIVDDALS